MPTNDFSLSALPIEAASLLCGLEGQSAGAVIVFEGRVRNHNDGRDVRALAYQAYTELAEAEGARIMDEARERFAVVRALCVHRVGELALGDLAVWVGVSAAHRHAAFAACRYVIDEVKKRVPIWKRENYADGKTEWLHPVSHSID